MGIYVDDSVFEQKKQAVLDEWGNILKQEMIIRCPRDTGNLVASIEKELKQGEVAVGTHGAPQAAFVEYGTGRHIIKAKNVPYLHFMVDGHEVWTEEVWHPGTIVGEYENPRETWKTLEERGEVGTGQTMPFARSASFFTEEERLSVLRHAFGRNRVPESYK